MDEIKLGEWFIRCLQQRYSLWKNSNEEGVIVEYISNKIATITLKLDGSIRILSENAYYEVNAEQHQILVWSPDDDQIHISA